MREQNRPQPDHGPYPPTIQALGGTPNPYTDTPICSVFLTLFVIAAGLHMGLFKYNQKKRQKFFPMNAANFGEHIDLLQDSQPDRIQASASHESSQTQCA